MKGFRVIRRSSTGSLRLIKKVSQGVHSIMSVNYDCFEPNSVCGILKLTPDVLESGLLQSIDELSQMHDAFFASLDLLLCDLEVYEIEDILLPMLTTKFKSETLIPNWKFQDQAEVDMEIELDLFNRV